MKIGSRKWTIFTALALSIGLFTLNDTYGKADSTTTSPRLTLSQPDMDATRASARSTNQRIEKYCVPTFGADMRSIIFAPTKLYGSVDPAGEDVTWWFEVWELDSLGRVRYFHKTPQQSRSSAEGIGQVIAEVSGLLGTYHYRLAGETKDGKTIAASNEGEFFMYAYPDDPSPPGPYPPLLALPTKEPVAPTQTPPRVDKKVNFDGRYAKMLVSCPADSNVGCEGTLTLQITGKIANNRIRTKARKNKKLSAGTLKVKLKPGERKRLRIKLSTKTRNRFEKSHRVQVDVVFRPIIAGTKPTAQRLTVINTKLKAGEN